MINSRLLLVVVDGKKVYIDDNDADLFDNPFLTLFNTKTSFLVLLRKFFSEKA